MKITKTQLKEIIKEEASKVLDEAPNNTPDADAFRAWLTRAAETHDSENIEEKLKEKQKLMQEARLPPDEEWWANAFHAVVADQIGVGEPTPEQRATILAGLQRAMADLRSPQDPRLSGGGFPLTDPEMS